ncbi:hypothetical protein KFU94_41150 [Chloroflexi bacterium TSY]|nr:hypothetical protein [Chloroflexi bacterium TSY]
MYKVELSVVQETRGEVPDPNRVRDHCHALVDKIVATATDEEREHILTLAQHMVNKAKAIIGKQVV